MNDTTKTTLKCEKHGTSLEPASLWNQVGEFVGMKNECKQCTREEVYRETRPIFHEAMAERKKYVCTRKD